MLEVFGGQLVDHASRGIRTGERHLAYERVLHQRAAHVFAETRNDIDYAWRKTGLVEQFDELQCRGRCEFGRLEHNGAARRQRGGQLPGRSEEHTSELQSLMRISYAVFCLKQKKNT